MTIRTTFLSTFLICFLFTNVITAEVFTSITGGNFDNPNTWDIGGGKIPGEMDDVVIKHMVYVVLNNKKTIKSLSLFNGATSIAGFEVNGSDSLVVLNNVKAVLNSNSGNLYLQVTDQATLIVDGNFNFVRATANNTNDYLRFTLIDNSKTFINGSFKFDYKGAGSGEGTKEIDIRNDAFLDVAGKTTFTNSGGEDFNFGLYNNAQAIFRDSLILALTGTGAEAGITLHDASSLQVLSSVYVLNSSTSSNDFAKLRAREEASSIYIEDNVYLDSDGAKTKLEAEGTGGTITVGGDIIMNASAEDEVSINIIEQGEIYLGGDLIRQNSFGKLTMANDGALILNGSSPQAIPESKLPGSGTDSLFFKEVRLENTSTQPFALTENLIVKDALILTNGNLMTDSTAMVVLEEGATIFGSSTAYIEGPVKKLGSTGGQDFVFPIGTSTAYAPITISPVSDPLSEITVQYLSEPPPFGAETFESSINNVSTNGHWIVEKNTNTGDLNLTLTWEDSNEAGIAEVADLVVAGWDGTEWVSYGQESAAFVGSGGFVESAFSEPPPFGAETFTLASTSSANALPVELNKFEATPRSGSVDLEWETESEINASHFLVERSTDGIIYESIQYVKSKGESTTPAHYTTNDPAPFFGWNYYRLKMVDQDDSYEYSPVAVVKVELSTSIMLYPNPVKEMLFIQDTEGVEDEVSVEIFDRNSNKLFEKVIQLNNGPVQLAIDDIDTLPNGYYIVKVTGKSGCKFLNFIIAE